ncbi:hypothetical protein Y032_0012g1868 [Ancylostoma ceylanicum]|uniref:Uncharacterized protein n=1 Tax=Ancylostoma ceylanicum TaxID=53326 RepID=A0A016VCL4_9BILA|nr:hypothetical protein Y032_0012g1868 [Ancylostoma ceylanicum]
MHISALTDFRNLHLSALELWAVGLLNRTASSKEYCASTSDKLEMDVVTFFISCMNLVWQTAHNNSYHNDCYLTQMFLRRC